MRLGCWACLRTAAAVSFESITVADEAFQKHPKSNTLLLYTNTPKRTLMDVHEGCRDWTAFFWVFNS